MNVFDIKVEKAKANLKYKRLQKVTCLFRLMEVCIFLFIISSISTQFQFSSKLPASFLRRLSITIFSPGFIFVVGNAIVIVLFLKYGQFSAQEKCNQNNSNDFSNTYIGNCENRTDTNQNDEIKKHGKGHMFEEIEPVPSLGILDSSNSDIFVDKKLQKSHSEDFKKCQHEDSHVKLRRTKTERYLKTPANNSTGKLNTYAEDKMSSDEFRRTVEAFIARQQRSLREEEDFSTIPTFERI